MRREPPAASPGVSRSVSRVNLGRARMRARLGIRVVGFLPSARLALERVASDTDAPPLVDSLDGASHRARRPSQERGVRVRGVGEEPRRRAHWREVPRGRPTERPTRPMRERSSSRTDLPLRVRRASCVLRAWGVGGPPSLAPSAPSAVGPNRARRRDVDSPRRERRGRQTRRRRLGRRRRRGTPRARRGRAPRVVARDAAPRERIDSRPRGAYARTRGTDALDTWGGMGAASRVEGPRRAYARAGVAQRGEREHRTPSKAWRPPASA